MVRHTYVKYENHSLQDYSRRINFVDEARPQASCGKRTTDCSESLEDACTSCFSVGIGTLSRESHVNFSRNPTKISHTSTCPSLAKLMEVFFSLCSLLFGRLSNVTLTLSCSQPVRLLWTVLLRKQLACSSSCLLRPSMPIARESASTPETSGHP